MGEIRSGLRGWMRWPWLYRLFQSLIGGDRLRRHFTRQFVRPSPGQRLLDLGCGPCDLVGYLPALEYYGLDSNPEYLQFARSHYGLPPERCVQAELTPASTLPQGPFDRVVALGLLHHLDDASVQNLLHQAAQELAPEGCWVSIDPCYHPGQSAWSRWWVSRDRGQHVRAHEEYSRLARQSFEHVESSLHQGLIRLPYSHCILVCQGRKN